MRKAGIAESLCKPKALRHAFAVEVGQKGIPLNIVQRWLGHARIETTAIYASASGDEERNLARRAWSVGNGRKVALRVGLRGEDRRALPLTQDRKLFLTVVQMFLLT